MCSYAHLWAGCKAVGILALACYALFCAPLSGAAAGGAPVLLIYGDSLGSGYGLAPGEGFGAQLQAALRSGGVEVRVRNASVAGETTAGGLARLDWILAGGRADAVLLELGANDALRGLSPEAAAGNLDRILARLAEEEIPVLLAGMRAPRNLGDDYAAAFDSLYPRLARKYAVMLYPFFLEGVATRAGLNQADGRHPNAQGVERIVERILPMVQDLLARAGAAQK